MQLRANTCTLILNPDTELPRKRTGEEDERLVERAGRRGEEHLKNMIDIPFVSVWNG